MQYRPGMLPNEFMRVNYKELLKFANWLLGRRGIRLPKDEIIDLVDMWFLRRASSVLRSYKADQGSSFDSYLRLCLDRHLLQCLNRKSESWHERAVSMDEVCHDGLTNLHERIGHDDNEHERVEMHHDLLAFASWCARRHVHRWALKKKYLRLMMLHPLGELHGILGCSRQNCYYTIAGIRQDYADYQACIASLC